MMTTWDVAGGRADGLGAREAVAPRRPLGAHDGLAARAGDDERAEAPLHVVEEPVGEGRVRRHPRVAAVTERLDDLLLLVSTRRPDWR